MIRFIGKRTIPTIDHAARHPHPASPTQNLPSDFAAVSSHETFSSYRDHAQQFGPLRKTIKTLSERGIGGATGNELGPVAASQGEYFDRNDLPGRFRRTPLSAAEIEAVETGGATLFA